MEDGKKRNIKKIIRFIVVAVIFALMFYDNYCKERSE